MSASNKEMTTTTTTALVSLPLHSRRASHLFQEILLTDAELTPELSELSLPLRLHEFQRRNLNGIQEAKRGTQFQRIRSTLNAEAENVTLQLASDGSKVEITAEKDSLDTVSICLLDIKSILLQAERMSFSLQLDFNMADVFVATNVSSFNHWIMTLTCGINAFQHQQLSGCTRPANSKAVDFVWQAVRLRTFELTDVLPLSTALEHIRCAISDQDLQDERLRQRLDFLYCNN